VTVYTPKEIIKLIEKDGWCLVGVEGSHHQFKHPNKKGKVTIPVHTKDLKKDWLIAH
jgi:predicted RNA binding protein YcfA (HicA-like mRNA interferase family)